MIGRGEIGAKDRENLADALLGALAAAPQVTGIGYFSVEGRSLRVGRGQRGLVRLFNPQEPEPTIRRMVATMAPDAGPEWGGVFWVENLSQAHLTISPPVTRVFLGGEPGPGAHADLRPGGARRPLACGGRRGVVGAGAVSLCRRLHAAGRAAARLCPLWPGPRAGASCADRQCRRPRPGETVAGTGGGRRPPAGDDLERGQGAAGTAQGLRRIATGPSPER